MRDEVSSKDVFCDRDCIFMNAYLADELVREIRWLKYSAESFDKMPYARLCADATLLLAYALYEGEAHNDGWLFPTAASEFIGMFGYIPRPLPGNDVDVDGMVRSLVNAPSCIDKWLKRKCDALEVR